MIVLYCVLGIVALVVISGVVSLLAHGLEVLMGIDTSPKYGGSGNDSDDKPYDYNDPGNRPYNPNINPYDINDSGNSENRMNWYADHKPDVYRDWVAKYPEDRTPYGDRVTKR